MYIAIAMPAIENGLKIKEIVIFEEYKSSYIREKYMNLH